MTRPAIAKAHRVKGAIPRRARSIAGALILLLWTGEGLAQTQRIDEEYTAKIKEFTTEPFFLTPYVDYLPASDTVPTPLDVLGHIAGAPDVLSYTSEVHRYMRAVADASPRVIVKTIGYSEEGREMILVIVSDEATIEALDRYVEMNGRLGDPRTITDDEAEQLIGQSKPIYMATGALHSGETGSPEMLMELVYRLAVDESPLVQNIRENVIFMTTPVTEVDGRDKQVDIHMAPRKDPDGNYPRRLLYWGKYVAHDNNRDGLGLSLNLTRNILNAYLGHNAQVLHDLHESASHLYTSTGTGPYNAWVDPILVNEWFELAYAEVSDLTAKGVPGVWTYGFYDGWAPNYMFYAANGHNGIGRFYETQGAGNASTRMITSSSNRAWYRPNPPVPRVMWSIRNNTNLMQSGLLVALNYVASNRAKFLRNFYLKSKRSVAKPYNEGPAAYVFPADDPRPGQQAGLLRLLQLQGVEVHRASRDITVGEQGFPAGSYVVRMDQPYSRMADMMLDRQYFNVNDPRPYDDVGWTMGPLFNARTIRVEDTAILDARMEKVEGMVTAEGGLERHTRRPAAFLINYNADARLTTFAFKMSDLKIEAAEAAFEAEGQKFNAGTFIVKTADNPGELEQQLREAGARYGFTAHSVADVPEVDTHPITLPRIALMHTWAQSTQNEGWVRIALDSNGIPYEYISVHEVRDNPRLKDRYDVIIFGPSTSNALSIVDGLPMTGDPMPWKKTDITPNIGVQDETDDMRGGLELEGVLHLRDFVREGGVFIALTSSASLPMHFGMAGGMNIVQTPDLWARGGVYRALISDRRSPISYGYGNELGVYFNSSPVFGRGGFGGFGRGFRGRGGAQGRPSGRGGLDDPDRVQGRPPDMGQEGVEAWQARRREEGETAVGPGRRGAGAAPRARTILRFATDVEKLLISGGLKNGEALAGSPAVLDAPLGDGHVVMFSINPMWRGQTVGSYALVFNALLHHDNLDAGRGEEDTESPPEGVR